MSSSRFWPPPCRRFCRWRLQVRPLPRWSRYSLQSSWSRRRLPTERKQRRCTPTRSTPLSLAPAIDGASRGDPTASWFDERELRLGADSDGKTDMFVDPAACVYPDAYLRSLAGGRDDCGLLNPGTDESEILTLPFLALSAWVVVICAIAALHHFHRNWLVWRWLRSMRAQGLVPIATNWRRPAQRRHRQSSRHGRTASRRYAG